MIALHLFDYLPAGVEPWAFLLVGSLSAFLFGLGKVGFGGSLGLLSVPLMIYACGGRTTLATGLMLPLLISADYCGVLVWRGRWDGRCVRHLLPGAAGGIVLAAVVMVALRGGGGRAVLDNGLKLLVGLIALFFVALTVAQALLGRRLVFRPVLWQATAGGALMGFTSTLAHAAGPVAGMYLLSQDMPRDRYAATSNLLFWLINQMKLPAYLLLGLIDTQSLSAGLWLAPAALLGAALGRGANARLSQRAFNLIVYGLLAAMGLHMAFKGYAALFMAVPAAP